MFHHPTDVAPNHLWNLLNEHITDRAYSTFIIIGTVDHQWRGRHAAPCPWRLGMNGQDAIVTGSSPVQIQAGSVNPMVIQGIVGPGAIIATSDSIVTAYIFDTPPGTIGYTGLSYDPTGLTDTPQNVSIVGFAQIFVSQVDATGNIYGYILSVAGCGSNPNAACGTGSGNGISINGSTTLPVRLITQGN